MHSHPRYHGYPLSDVVLYIYSLSVYILILVFFFIILFFKSLETVVFISGLFLRTLEKEENQSDHSRADSWQQRNSKPLPDYSGEPTHDLD